MYVGLKRGRSGKGGMGVRVWVEGKDGERCKDNNDKKMIYILKAKGITMGGGGRDVWMARLKERCGLDTGAVFLDSRFERKGAD